MSDTHHRHDAFACGDWIASKPGPLEQDEVHLWRARLEQPAELLDELNRLLSAEEKARASKFHHDLDRTRFVAAHGILRVILGHYLGVAPRSLAFAAGSSGKPRLRSPSSTDLTFNMAHSGGAALYGVARGRQIGVDIEHIRPVPEADFIAQRMFSAAEYAGYSSAPDAGRELLFFQIWTRHEARVKASGLGLANGSTGGTDKTADVLASEETWLAGELRPFPDCVAALAADGAPSKICSWEWTPVLHEENPLSRTRPE